MARGHRGGKVRKFANTKTKKEDIRPSKRQYEEFGEAHPIDEKEAVVKRLKVDDTEDTNADDERGDDAEGSSSEEEGVETDALSSLLATFNTHTGKAIDSDEEEQEEEEDMLGCSDEGDGESDESDTSDANDSEEEKGASKNAEENMDLRVQGDISGGEDSDSSENGEKLSDSSDEEEAIHDKKDPFSKHFEQNLNELCAEQVRDRTKWTSTFQKWPTLGRIKVEVPKVELQTSKPLLLAEENEANNPPAIGLVPQPPDLKHFSLQDYHIKKSLRDNVTFMSQSDALGVTESPASLTNLQKELLCVLSSYSDMYYPEASLEHWVEVRTVYALHAVNHVLKTRKRILNHNAKHKSKKKKKRGTVSDVHRDQGYTRPKVLILLPFKHSAYLMVNILVMLLLKGTKTHVQNYGRFEEDFGPGAEEEEGRTDKLSRPEDFVATFKGDTNEDFKLGIKVTKNSLKLYADFYQSDIIVASPLGLRYIMGSTSRTDIQTDFLTSIEILILDQADIFMMQNWEHILVLMEAINKPPHDVHKLSTDLTRVRLWSLEGHAPLYRQTLVFSSTTIDHHRALISKCHNFAGKLEVLNPAEGGSVQEVVVHTHLTINNITGLRDLDTRFRHFTDELLPRLRAEQRSHTLVYIPDYCDYVRLLRHLKEDGGTSIASINEYMVGQNSKVAKVRSLFFEGKRNFLLYTERFHFYRRYRIKGVRHVIFYDLPTFPHFFSEICNLMVESNQNPRTRKKYLGRSTVTVIVQKSDLTRLIGILGSQRTADILSSGKAIHTCVLGK